MQEPYFGYGTTEKKIMFHDTDHNHAQLKIKLHYDNLKQGEFFRALVKGYVNNHPSILEFIELFKKENNLQSQVQINKIKKEQKRAKKIKEVFALEEDEVEDIFDILQRENPDL